jgi:hypothetical protein
MISVAFVFFVKPKADCLRPARELYTSPWFRDY